MPGMLRPPSAAVRMRAFNRFYTEQIGALDDRHEGLDLTLAESRCLFTIDRLGGVEAGALAAALDLDLGYVSRLVSRLEQAGRVCRTPDPNDRRHKSITLTDRGTRLLAEVVDRSNARMDALVSDLNRSERARLLEAMEVIHELLRPKVKP